MARIPYPETQHLPHELRDLLRQTNLNIFLMWAHSVNTVGIVAQLARRSLRSWSCLARSENS